MNDTPKDPFDDLMRQALHQEADRIEPSDALPEIRARAHAQRRSSSRRPWLLTAGVAAVGTAAAIGAFTVFTGNDDTATDGDQVAGQATTTATASDLPTTAAVTPKPSPVPSTPAPSTMPSTAKSSSGPTVGGPTVKGRPEQAVRSATVPVYWVGAQAGVKKKTTPRLYRTFTKVSGHPVEEAVRIMSTKRPEDSDYYSLWQGAAVNSVTLNDGLVTVDFKQLPKNTLDPNLADVAAQQLIYTVQGVLKDSTSAVQITEAGRTGQKLFGQIDTSSPLGRAQADNVQALVWITSPIEGEVVSGKVLTVQGTANAFEATVNYAVTNLKTGETKKSFTNAAEGQKFSPYSFRVPITPGSWEVSVYLLSPADGSITDADTKTVLVR
ncbi:Gmad2 immunoglobulin-like domain-containing protein [Kribbella sp. NPDC026611]|uniref:Gmad2 immunoglobulin-like domain-containing protein n=1 Tax=Kribbella sp. NPDC026611 TaxID=3154911 RepID=UPI0033FCFD5B